MKKIILFIICAFYTNVTAQSSWQIMQAHSTDNKMFSIPESSITYIIGAKDFILKSTNNGINWITLSTADIDGSYTSISFINSETGWITSSSTPNNILQKTTNGGINWSIVNLGSLQYVLSAKLINENTGFVIKQFPSQVYKTSNNGANWILVNLPFSTFMFYALTDQILYCYQSDPIKLARSTNSGQSWDTIYSANGQLTVEQINFLNNNTGWIIGQIGVSGSYNALYTTNGGTNWNGQLISSSNSQLKQINFLNNLTFYLTRNSFLWKSTNSGINWLQHSSLSVVDLVYIKNPNLMLGVDNYGLGGIYKSTDEGLNWTSYFNTSDYEFRALYFLNDQTGWICGRENAIYKTVDGAQTLTRVEVNPTGSSFLNSMDFINSQFGWAVGGLSGVNEVFRTENAGLNWQLQNFPTNDYESIWKIKFTNTTTGFIISRNEANQAGKIYRTTNFGDNWMSPTVLSQFNPSGICKSGTNTMWVCGGYIFNNTGKICKTINNGDNWILTHTFSNSYLYDIEFINENTGFAGGKSGVDGLLLKTTDGGDSWINITPPNTGDIHSIEVKNDGYLFVLSEPHSDPTMGKEKFKISLDFGNTWKPAQQKLVGEYFSAYFSSSNTGYIVGEGGLIIKTTNRGITYANIISENIPETYSLLQNYPNPFNPSTKIKFEIPLKSKISILIYDITGKQIAKVIDNEIFESGTYETEFNATGFASGIYFYKLISDRFTQTKRMVLIK